MQFWCMTWPPNGSSRIRVKLKPHRKLKGACKSSWSRQGCQKSFTLTITWKLAKLVKTLRGIIAHQPLICSETVGWWQSGLDENRWADSMECYFYLRDIQDKLSDWKTPYERRFGEPFEGPIVRFGSLVEYHATSTNEQSRIHQFGKKVHPGILRGGNLEGRHTGCGP